MPKRPRPHRPAWFVKDVLRVGRWHVGPHVLFITPRILNGLVGNFRLAKARGVRIPVVWNHSDDARDQVGWIDDLFVRGPELMARFWAAQPADVARIGRANQETSVELVRDFADGLGRRYGLMLAHLGIVQHPVVPRQRPFVRLSLHTSKGARFAMNNANIPPIEASATDPAKKLKPGDIAKIVATVNRILQALGSLLLLPDDTKEKELTERLDSIASQLGPEPQPDEVPADSFAADSAADNSAADSELSPGDIDAEVAQLRLQLSQSRQQLRAERQRGEQERQRLFVGSLDRMVEQGRLTPADRGGVYEAGRSAGFALSLLTPFERIAPGSAFPTDRIASRHAHSNEPSVRPGATMSDERAKQLARCFAD